MGCVNYDQSPFEAGGRSFMMTRISLRVQPDRRVFYEMIGLLQKECESVRVRYK